MCLGDAVAASDDVPDLAGSLRAIELTPVPVRSFQVPAGDAAHQRPGRQACPGAALQGATRVTSTGNRVELIGPMVLMVSFHSRYSPRTIPVIFLDRSPLATGSSTSAMFADLRR